jgi:hypothetical protein
MSVTEELLRNNAIYAESFEKGDLPLPPASARSGDIFGNG